MMDEVQKSSSFKNLAR